MNALIDSVNSMKDVQWQKVSVTRRDTSITGVVSVVTTTTTQMNTNGPSRQGELYQQDSLPDAEMQVALANLQVAKARLHEERNTMAQGWETRVKKLKEPFRKMQGLKAELYELEKQATYTQKLANNPSFSYVKSALAEKSVAISQKQTELKLQIDSIEKDEIRPNLDYTHFKRMARNMDSIRAYEEEIIRMSEEMGVEPIDHPRVAPRPPKPPLPRLAPVKPVAPAPAVKPVPAPRPAAAPKPAPTPRPAPAPAPKR